MTGHRLTLLALMLGTAPAAFIAPAAFAQDQAEDIDPENDIVVSAGRPVLRGSVQGEIKPEQTLGGADVRALGVTSIAELITELAPQTNAAGGQPVVLLNGKRISGFQEIQDLPSEAVARVEILPEQVSLSYGYAPNQKVVNIVLRRRFNGYIGEVRGGTSTQGGRETGRVDAGMMRIAGDNRFTLNLRYDRAGDLLESERGVTPTADPAAPVVPDLGRYNTLSPATESFSANATLARALGNVSASLNGRLELTDSDSLQGLPLLETTLTAGNPFSPFAIDTPISRYVTEAGALRQQVKGTNARIGLSLNGGLAPGWLWSFTGAGELNDIRTRTDRGIAAGPVNALIASNSASFNPFGPLPADLLANRLTDTASARSRAINGDLLISGSPFELPAGKANVSFTLGASANGLKSQSLRNGTPFAANYSREVLSGQASIDLPLTSRSKDVLGFLGDIGVNMNAGVQKLSDFGTLTTLGYGARWSPIPQVRLLVSASQDRAAPSGQQINDPVVSTPNVSVFDYATGNTVLVTQVSGGNLGLRESVRDQFRINATIKPLEKTNLTFTVNYLNRRTTNPISAFPTPTPQIEAAFPGRFTRDQDGMLIAIDSRPINYQFAQSESLRWGMDLSFPLKSSTQKQFEAWRAAGSKPEDRPADLRALFGNRQRGEGRDDGGRGSESGEGGRGADRPEGERRPDGSMGSPGGDGPRAGGWRGGRGGGFGGGGRGGGGGRLQFSLYHTWHLKEQIRVAPGVPVIDLLNGGAVGSSGGQPRHEIEGRVGYSNNGLGARLSVDWESGTRVDGALNGASQLTFGDLTTVNLRLFANLGQMPKVVQAVPFLRGSRIQFNIDNIFNQRRDVRDATGATPIRYQPGYLDPVGRSFTISFRKLFF